ncbi:MAG: adenylyltransferase/cytidyltransferase family protein [Chitinispirillales bacterium]|jgi:rfaE bifunctional protein nucleotidyltransferase chain/domain|nr:adenylyltransferase/cytidyltransferase family protein [Chitinispirillales bacterium]
MNTHICRTVQEIQSVIEPLRREGKTLVTTNGCFDLLHSGHIKYLCEAAQLGDMLVVGINSDESVRKLKGAGRPVQSEADRALIIGSLKMVFGTFVFHEDDPRAFISVLKPDVHVKGGDYTKDILERQTVEENGGRVEILSFLDGRSTTSIVSKIRG